MRTTTACAQKTHSNPIYVPKFHLRSSKAGTLCAALFALAAPPVADEQTLPSTNDLEITTAACQQLRSERLHVLSLLQLELSG
jgi:hypothetical protein